MAEGLRAAARALLEAAIRAGDAGALVEKTLGRSGERLRIAGREIDLRPVRRVLVLGAGKASAAMAAAVEKVLGDRPVEGLVAVKDLAGPGPRRVRLAEAGHPIPDIRGAEAARAIRDLADGAGPGDLVIGVISGGGSALLPAPVPGVSLAEKQEVTRLLLQAGATINELNAVRKHLSALKGGQLARAVQPAPLVTLVLSDVIGDPLDVIASGPTVADPTTYADAVAVVDRFGLRARMPASVLRHLEAGRAGDIPDTPKAGEAVLGGAITLVVGNNDLVVDAARDEATRRGWRPLVLTRRLQGEAREVARVMGAMVRQAAISGEPVGRPGCLLAAGETTVTVRGRGKGGRCQELALALVTELAGLSDVVALAAGTDGSDGPTDAAGAVVDGDSLVRARATGLDPAAALAANDAYPFFDRLGDLVVTGPTGTNLLDLYLALLGPVPPEGAVR